MKKLMNIFAVIALAVSLLGLGASQVAIAQSNTTPILKDEVCKGGAAGCDVNIPGAHVSVDTTQAIIKVVFGVAAVLSVIFVAVGGFKYTIASGDPSSIQSAKNTILYAIIGLGVSISAFVIVQYVIAVT